MLPLCTILIFDFGIVPTVWYCMFFISFIYIKMSSSKRPPLPSFVTIVILFSDKNIEVTYNGR